MERQCSGLFCNGARARAVAYKEQG